MIDVGVITTHWCVAMLKLQSVFVLTGIKIKARDTWAWIDSLTSPSPLELKHSLPVGLTKLLPNLQESWGATTQLISSLPFSQIPLFFIRLQSKCCTRTNRWASFGTLRIPNTTGCTSVKTFHIKHNLSQGWGERKRSDGIINKRRTNRESAVWATSSRRVTISISNSGRTNRLRGGIRHVNHWWNKSLFLLLCYCHCHIYMLKNGNLLLGAGVKTALLWVSSGGKYSWADAESGV